MPGFSIGAKFQMVIDFIAMMSSFDDENCFIISVQFEIVMHFIKVVFLFNIRNFAGV